MAEDKIITFVNGILGLEDYKEYILLNHPDTDILKWLQSNDNPNVALPVANPAYFFPDYRPLIRTEELETIKISSPEDAFLLCVITVPKDPKNTTINLKAPIIINLDNLLADQIICENEEYHIRHPLIFKQKTRRCSNC